jgi:hypothetical protein
MDISPVDYSSLFDPSLAPSSLSTLLRSSTGNRTAEETLTAKKEFLMMFLSKVMASNQSATLANDEENGDDGDASAADQTMMSTQKQLAESMMLRQIVDQDNGLTETLFPK